MDKLIMKEILFDCIEKNKTPQEIIDILSYRGFIKFCERCEILTYPEDADLCEHCTDEGFTSQAQNDAIYEQLKEEGVK